MIAAIHGYRPQECVCEQAAKIAFLPLVETVLKGKREHVVPASAVLRMVSSAAALADLNY